MLGDAGIDAALWLTEVVYRLLKENKRHERDLEH